MRREPFLVVARVTTGMSTASMRSPMFSISTDVPSSTAFPSLMRMSGCPSRTMHRPAPSRSRTHAMPCSCGSIMSGHRAEFTTTAPFSTDTRSDGRPWLFQLATCASVVRMDSGLAVADMGMATPDGGFARNGTQSREMRPSRKCEVKGPM